VLTKPQQSAVVEFLDVSSASRIARELITGACAWRRIDERFLPTKLYDAVGSRLGPEFRDVYGRVKGLLRDAEKLLWILRSGQAPLAYKLCDDVHRGDRIGMARDCLDSMIEKKYLGGGWPRADEPWIPIADAAIELTDELIKSLTASGWSPVGITTSSLREMLRAEYYDKVIAVAREYAIYLVLRRLRRDSDRARIGGDDWQQVDERLKQLHSARRAQSMAPRRQELEALNVSDEVVELFDELRQFRNKLMHGGLSREFQADIELGSGRVLEAGKDRDKEPISKDEARIEAEKALCLIERLMG